MIKTIGLFAFLMILSFVSLPTFAETRSSGGGANPDFKAGMVFTEEEQVVIETAVNCVEGEEKDDEGKCVPASE